jgi:hypothetical protein
MVAGDITLLLRGVLVVIQPGAAGYDIVKQSAGSHIFF